MDQTPDSDADWQAAGLLYHTRGFANRRRFGAKVWKISLDAGLDCPNRDGTVGRGGCVFCDPASFSPSRRQGPASIAEQITRGIAQLSARGGVERFVAYFQPATNTYAPVDRLRELYEEAIAHPGIVALAVGTRPDCVPDGVLDLLAELSERTWVTVEYGMQTSDDRLLRWMNRGHDHAAFLDAVARTRQRGVEIGLHAILGLPGQTRGDVAGMAAELGRLDVGSVKLHNLHAVRGTRLAELVERGEVSLPSQEKYVAFVADFLERLPARIVVDRLSGDAPPEYLVGPVWCLQKSTVRQAVEAELRRRETRQGSRAE